MWKDRSTAARLDTPRIMDWVLHELLAMARSARIDWRSECLFGLYRTISQLLDDIGRLGKAGKIHPRLPLRVAPSDASPSPSLQALRVGVYPVAGDPIHWGHLSSALLAIERLKLDKVVFVITDGGARGPGTIPGPLRHGMAAAFLPCFHPLLEYSPVARDTGLDGETGLFRLLELNRHQLLHAFYLAGNEHWYRFDPTTEEPDTIEKLERNVADRVFDYNARMHRISMAFFENEGQWAVPRSSLSITRLPGSPIRVSSASIFRALAVGRSDAVLLTLPYTQFRLLVDSGFCDHNHRNSTLHAKRPPHESGTEPVVSMLPGMN